MLIADGFSSRMRPCLRGARGAVSAAHPLATAAGQEMLLRGGSAADATIAAQAVIAVIAPEAAGIGGDGFFLVREPGGGVVAVNAAGASPAAGLPESVGDDGSSVTVPGLVAGWGVVSQRWGRLGLGVALEPAIRLAQGGFAPRAHLVAALAAQHSRLLRGGARDWPLFATAGQDRIAQPALAQTLQAIATKGPSWLYQGTLASEIAAVVASNGGRLAESDLATHQTVVAPPVTVEWAGQRVHVQPPMSQGILLAMALVNCPAFDGMAADQLDHIAIELTEASFAYRSQVGHRPDLLRQTLGFDPDRASRRGGPRSYLHTAGVAAADADGMTVASLISVFDDFGSAIYVPEGGFVLNNRAGGFTDPPNQPAAGKRPVHTLAPIIVETESGVFGLATPGADGQVQTLLQILLGAFVLGMPLADAVDRPRWRSQDNRLLIGAGHPSSQGLAARGHDLVSLPDADLRFGGVVCAGMDAGTPFALSDWRRENWSGVV